MDDAREIRRACRLIENEGESVVYRGEQWWYLRRYYAWTRDAVRLLESKGKLIRWSRKTPNLVRVLE